MHDLSVIDSSGDFLEQDVMPDVIEKGAQIEIKDPGLLLRDRLRDSRHRRMCRPFGPVAIRPRLEISLEDGLEDELECALHHVVADGRNRQYPEAFASAL